MTVLLPLLRVQALSRRFGGLQAVQDVSFDMAAGEILGLMGANGAGKTTLFAMIAGNLPPSSGQIQFEGKPLPVGAARVCQRGIARTFQIVRPFAGMTVLDNCMVGALYGSGRIKDRVAARNRCLDLLEEVGLAGLNAAEVDEALALIARVRERYELSIIIIEHVMKVLMRMSQRVVVLHEGRKLTEGLPAEVANDPRVIGAYLGTGGNHHAT